MSQLCYVSNIFSIEYMRKIPTGTFLILKSLIPNKISTLIINE